MMDTEQTDYEAMVSHLLTESYGAAVTESGGESDAVCLTHNGWQIRVHVIDADERPALVAVSHVVAQVEDRGAAAIAVALLNRSIGPEHWVLSDNDVYLAARMPIWPMLSGHLECLVRRFAKTLDREAPNLVLRTGTESRDRERWNRRSLLDAPYVPLGHDRDGLRQQVGDWLEHRLGAPQPIDGDGDFEIEHDGQPVWIEICKDRSAVVIFARVVTGARDLRTAAREAALTTNLAQASTWYPMGADIWQRCEVPVQFFFAEHLDQAMDEFLASFERVQDDLALLAGGRVEI